MPNIYGWLESKQDPMAQQLVTIAGNVKTQGAAYGLTPGQIATLEQGAAMNFYLEVTLIGAAHDYASALVKSRDELQLDKTVEAFALPQWNPPAPPSPVAGAETLMTDFLDYFNARYGDMQRNGLTAANAQAMGFLVPSTESAPNPATMKSRVTSILTESAGKTTIVGDRQNQKQIHFRVTLDSGQVFDKVLPNSRATFMLPTDRVHSFDAMVIYADSNGDDYGQWSDVKSDTSEL